MNGRFEFFWMHGRHVAEVAAAEFDYWHFVLSQGGCITASCPWRLIRDGHIAISGDDQGQQFGLPAPVDAVSLVPSLLAESVIERVEVREGTADLIIHFDHSFRLEVIPFSSGYESWQVTAPDMSSIFAQGGGQLCSVPATSSSVVTATSIR